MTPRRVLAGLISLTALCLGAAGKAGAQAIEHYAPLHLHVSPAVPPRNDTLPIGPPLREVVVTAGGQLIKLPTGVNLDATAPFAGQAISQDLIRKIEADVKARFGATEAPVAVQWIPAEDLAKGVVHVEVSPSDDQQGGQAAEQAPVKARAWDAYVGYKYFGTRNLTIKRILAGGAIRDLGGHGSELAFVTTLSPDRVMHAARHPKFNESFITYTLPMSRRRHFEASLDLIELNFHIAPTIYRFIDTMASAGLRQDIGPADQTGVARDIRFGIEAKNEQLTELTGGVLADRASSEVYQLYAGYHAAHDKDGRHDDLDVLAHFSPGGLDAGNTGAQHLAYSRGRVPSARYAYVYLTYDHRSPLGDRMDWHSQVIGELASGPLPFSEQPALGGAGLVRGYHFIDGSFDDILIVRNELGLTRKDGKTGAFVFWDIGSGRDKSARTTDLLGSFGLGASLDVTSHTKIEINAVHTLGQGQFTAAGTDELAASLLITF